jgi:hypothetical protein
MAFDFPQLDISIEFSVYFNSIDYTIKVVIVVKIKERVVVTR